MSDPPTPSQTPKPSPPGVDDGTCQLFGPPALVVQGLMGVMVILTLVYKRQHEKPRRRWRIWTFDVSKQLVGQPPLLLFSSFMRLLISQYAGQLVVHFSNVFISDLVAHQAIQNPCVLYFLNIVVDTTVGMSPPLVAAVLYCGADYSCHSQGLELYIYFSGVLQRS